MKIENDWPSTAIGIAFDGFGRVAMRTLHDYHHTVPIHAA